MQKLGAVDSNNRQGEVREAPKGESHTLIPSAVGVLKPSDNRDAPESHSCRPLSSRQSSTNDRSAPESLPVARTSQAAASSGRFPVQHSTRDNRDTPPD